MPAKHHIDKNNKLIITTWEGNANDDDLIDAMKRYQEDTQSKPEYADYNEVLDFSRVTDIKVSVPGLRGIGKIASETDRSDKNRRLAIIAPSNTTYFFARMYQVLRSFPGKSNKKVNIFTKENDALEWIIKDDR